jgi:hypothetical protein
VDYFFLFTFKKNQLTNNNSHNNNSSHSYEIVNLRGEGDMWKRKNVRK